MESVAGTEETAATVDTKCLDWGDDDVKGYENDCEKSDCPRRESGREHGVYQNDKNNEAASKGQSLAKV